MDRHPTDQHTTNTSTDRRALLTGIGGLAAGAFLAGKANAGPLTPPPGPIAPTPGPEPRIAINSANTPTSASARFRITQPGSYYLEGNITGAVGKHGIEIESNGVTVDLMGFELIGVSGSLDGVKGTGVIPYGVTIRNGSIRNWGRSGINFFDNSIANTRISEINAHANGVHGISALAACTVTRCSATNNAGIGIITGIHCVISDCLSRDNGIAGIFASSACAVINCSSIGNQDGFQLASGSTVINCTANTNSGVGFSIGGSTLTNCIARSSGSNGFAAGVGATLTNCTATSNGSNGIIVQNDCLVRGNMCHANGTSGTGAGIRVSSSDNRIEDNNCTDNRIGIQCTASGNFITRNTCSGNTTQNWSVASNNACLVVNATLSPAITGNSGGTSPGSTNPNANYTY